MPCVHTGLFISLRHSRSAIIAWILTALMMPVLLSLLPSPVTAAEQAAYAELQQSFCEPTHSQSGSDTDQHSKQACVLCVVGCSVAQPAAAPQPAFVLVFVQKPRTSAVLRFDLRSAVSTPALIRPSPPRGPPLSTI